MFVARNTDIYQVFRMDTGLSGNIFTMDFKRFGHLAEHSWFKHTWELCCLFNVQYTITSAWDFPLVRQADKGIMNVLVDLNIYGNTDLDTINRVRRFKKAFFLSDLVLADGSTMDPTMLDGLPGVSTKTFSYELPLPRDILLWRNAMWHIFAPT